MHPFVEPVVLTLGDIVEEVRGHLRGVDVPFIINPVGIDAPNQQVFDVGIFDSEPLKVDSHLLKGSIHLSG
ncbi:hypothetical protein ES708_25702 [subsurface metagenome]